MKDFWMIENWHWEITRRCNLKCIHCITGDKSVHELNRSQCLKALSLISDLGGKKISLTGGEPLIRSDLNCLIQKAHQLGLEVEMITNGTVVKENFLSKTGKLLSHIAVSIDGTEKIHDRIRGKGTYSKSISSIKKILECDIPLSVYVTVNSMNENVISIIMEELISLGIRSYRFNEINKQGRTIKNSHLLLSNTPLLKRAENLLLQMEKSIEINTSMIEIDSTCTITPGTVYLSASGTVYACAELAMMKPGKEIANIFDSDFRKRVTDYFRKIFLPEKCRYVVYKLPGIHLCLNRFNSCPFVFKRRRKSD